MRTKSNSIGLAALLASVGLAIATPFAGCGGDAVSINKPPSNNGGGGGGGEAGAGGGGAGGGVADCGNGVVEGNEACDDGNAVSGDGCENDCSFSCNNATVVTGDGKCDDKDPCNGAEKCLDTHVCAAGDPAADGTDCGNKQICISGVCSVDQCGDLFQSSSEECDDGNVTNGDGCDSCAFSCVSTDPARDCTNLDPCVATACDDATHTCGKPIGDGQPCATGKVCKNGVCTSAICGNGAAEPGEICDDGNLLDGDGCDADCTYSCVNAATDCAAAPVCQTASCNAAHVCVTTNVNVDAKCLAPNTCVNGACQAPNAMCGNGAVETGEDCDFGAQNGANTGCETNCKFSCNVNSDCVDMNTCNGTETCAAVTVGGNAGKKCSAGTNAANCSTCTGGLCNNGVCTASTCGDGCVNAAAGEQCEPPNTTTCDAMCKTITVAVCSNGIRESGEQCDDGNTTNLDGCSSMCKFEQVQRVNWLLMRFNTDTYCTKNQLGSAIGSQAQNSLQTSISNSIADGSITTMFSMMNLDDLTGTSDPAVNVAVLNGAPIIPVGVMYNGASDLDWWHSISAASIDMARNPIYALPGLISGKVLNAGPGTAVINIDFAGALVPMKFTSAMLTSSIGATNTPLTSTGNPPGHLASENLDPALQSYATGAGNTQTTGGKLCGNVGAMSLAQAPVPADLLPGGQFACTQGYSAANTLLDVIVNGCSITVFGFPVQVIIARDPDERDPAAPVAGAGHPYNLSVSAATKSVNACADKNGTSVNLQTCLDAAAYSSFFQFATNRAIPKP